ncbi:unnamed protein product [Diatraea saccharalis]|uniref:Uncharacterized protein n=1 Tax=Diatraea saccharalis TaxID=40085 RepID=A0A9N9RCV0_9NEOP|nr:unnamed protein product [Diatraea saccharalis]
MTSKEGRITCEYNDAKRFEEFNSLGEDQYDFVIDIVDDIIDKVDELVNEEKHDFEMLVYPIEKYDENRTRMNRTNEYLDTIHENDYLLNDTSILSPDDVQQIVSDADSDGLVNDKLLICDIGINEDLRADTVSSVTVSSNIKCRGDSLYSESKRGSVDYQNSIKSDLRSIASSESTLKMPSGELSVQSLLQYLREKTASSNRSPSIADID